MKSKKKKKCGKVKATISMYFEIKMLDDDYIYSEINIDVDTDSIPKNGLCRLREDNIKNFSMLCRVSEENIKVISRQEYMNNTEDSEEFSMVRTAKWDGESNETIDWYW